jgi:hypothetical protein
VSLLEVADRRVSRLHCTLTLQQDALPAGLSSNPAAVQLRDLSSNGTFLNGHKMVRGSSVTLAEGDVISLVLAVVPLSEISYTLRLGAPDTKRASAKLTRTTTSKYTSAAEAILDDLACPICLELLDRAVALEPCGHSFCAACLAQHLGAQLRGEDDSFTCPFR